MATLICDLTFNDRVPGKGHRAWKVYPAGTPIYECRAAADKHASEEVRICRRRVADLANDGDPNFGVWMVGGMPRILHEKFWNAQFVEEGPVETQSTVETVKQAVIGNSLPPVKPVKSLF